MSIITPSPPGVTPKVCSGCGRMGEWPGQPCPLCQDGAVPLDVETRNAFDPISLHELAMHLRDQKWLDMHVDDERGKLVKRVRLTSIIVRTTDELVSARQEWVEDDDEGDPRFSHQDLVFDAEAIWRVTSPSLFEIEGLVPFGMDDIRVRSKNVRVESHDDFTDLDAKLMMAILAAVSAETGIDEDEFKSYKGPKATRPGGVTQARYFAMLLLYDMTQLHPRAITKAFGYESPQPLYSAADEVRLEYQFDKDGSRKKRALAIRARLAGIARVVDTGMKHRHRRQPMESRYVL